MTARKTSWVLAAAAGLAIGTGAFAQQRQPDRSNPGAGDNQANRSNAPDQQRAQAADDVVNQLLNDMAQDPKTAADKLFVLTAALHNRAEIDLAREVMQKSNNPQVKQLAQRMIDQLQKTQQHVQQTAQAIGLKLPADLGRAAVQEVNVVAALPEDQIDRQYTAHAQADNARDASAYGSEAQIAQDPQVKRFAQDEQQGIRQRQQDSDQTAQAMGMHREGEAQPASGNIPAGGGNR
ncbi:MAG TPA: DUF4142 domain-containing protein [Tepidisphaeraceae bacterium]|jgi:predicted outer membrane protein